MNNILKKKLVIELKSDLIIGSGEGWGNIVDTDIIYDQYGFPYIPAKRMKGLLKEAALELEEFHVFTNGTSDNIFGNEEQKGHHFVLYNAFLSHIDEMRNEIDHIKKDYKKYVTIPSVLNHYTTIRYQTALDNNGIAQENSLRSSRAILKNHKFYAYMECEQQDLELIEKCAKMVHHMGMSRNRGFGEVDLYIEDNVDDLKFFELNMKDDVEYDVQLYLVNKTELSIASFQKEKSLDYISGSSILGYFANEYLKHHDVDQRFYDLFVLGHVKFSNAYISDEYWNEYYPVRESLYKQKVGDQYFDKTIENLQEILSKVRHKYMSCHCIDDSYYMNEVEKELYYHHRRPQDKSIGHVVSNERIEDGTFYQLEVISANQRFIAHINGLGKDLKDVLSSLSSYIQIGKSKYTQYGNVYVDHISCDKVKNKIIPAGSEVVCTLISPLLLLDSKKESQLDPKVLSKLLHIKNPQCFVGYTNIGGYHAKWRLQKPAYVAFCEGSCIKGILKEDVNEKMIVGNLVQEGLGQVIVQKISDIKNNFNDLLINNDKEVHYTKEIIIDGLKHELRLNALKEIDSITLNKLITKTLMGRLLRMLENSSWDQFVKDVHNIANKDKNKAAVHFIDDIQYKCDLLFDNSLLSQFVNEQYKKEFYMQTCKDYLIHEKIERRNVQ